MEQKSHREIPFYFRVADAELYGGSGSIGYCSTAFGGYEKASPLPEEAMQALEGLAISTIAASLHVECSQVTAITYEEYLEETGEENE